MKVHYLKALASVALLCVIGSSMGCKPKKTVTGEPTKPVKPEVKKVDPVKPEPTKVEPVKPDVKPPEPKPVAEVSPTDVLVTVNGVDITQAQLTEMTKPHLERLAKRAANLPPQFLEQQKKTLTEQALKEMVRIRLLDEKAAAANITITDAEMDAELNKMIAMQKPAVTLEEFKQKIIAYGYSFDQWKAQIGTMLKHQKLVVAEYPEKSKVTVADANAFYVQNKRRYDLPEQVRASHILIKTDLSDPNSDPNTVKAAAKAKAEDLLKQVKEGADFAELAKANSGCPSAAQGGDLNFFRKGQMVPAFDKVAFALEVGKVHDEVVETQFGYHVIKVTERKDAAVTPFDEVKDTIMNELKQRKMRTLAMEYVEKLKTEAKITYAPGHEPKPPAPPVMPGAPRAPAPPPPSR